MQAPEAWIVATPFKAHPHTLERGDRYDKVALGISDETDRTFRYIGHVLPLTPESYANAMAHHPAGHIGRGFNVEQLLEWGIITPKAAKAVDEERSKGEHYRGYWIVPFKHVTFVRFNVVNADNILMRDKPFAGRDTAVKFIDALIAEKDAATPEGQEESQDHGLHVRSGALQPA